MGMEIFKKYEITSDEKKKLDEKVENFEMQVTHPIDNENDFFSTQQKELTNEENTAMYNAFMKRREKAQKD